MTGSLLRHTATHLPYPPKRFFPSLGVKKDAKRLQKSRKEEEAAFNSRARASRSSASGMDSARAVALFLLRERRLSHRSRSDPIANERECVFCQMKKSGVRKMPLREDYRNGQWRGFRSGDPGRGWDLLCRGGNFQIYSS